MHTTTSSVPREPATGAGAPTKAAGLAPVMLLALAVQAALLAGLVWPLRIWQAPDAITAPEPLSEMLGRTPAGLARFVLTLAVWVAGYAVALYISRRPLSRSARIVLMAAPVVAAVTLAATWPAASKDVYHYVFEGRTLVFHGENPLTTPPAALPHDPLSWIISSWEWEPARYGPLWALVAGAPALLGGDDLRATVLGFKAIGVGSFVATIALVYAAARRVRGEFALTAFVFVAWNPLLIFEAAAGAHNDLLMVAFTTAALYCAARRDWLFAFPALTAAVLVKYTTGLLGPVLLLWAWRNAESTSERRSIAAGIGLSLWLTVACYAIFWAGPDTFSALRGAAGESLNSPGWLFRAGLEAAGLSETTARIVVSVPLTLVFLAGYALVLRGAWRGHRDVDALWRYGFLALTLYLWTISWWFWPWYVTWVIPLAGLLAGSRLATYAAVWSVAALAAYVPINFRPLFWGEPPDDRMPLAAALVIFVPAAAAALVLLARDATHRRSPVR
jgi:hypothetical protein